MAGYQRHCSFPYLAIPSMRASNYDKFPFVPVAAKTDACQTGWAAITGMLRSALGAQPASPDQALVLVVECYPGTDLKQLQHEMMLALQPAQCLVADELYYSPAEIDRMVAGPLTDDPVFGRMNGLTVANFFNPQRLQAAQAALASASDQLTIIVGTGATLVCPAPTLIVYADLARWEIQLRQRRGEVANLVAEAFELFFRNIITKYPGYQAHTFNCVGSVAYNFRDVLTQVATAHGMTVGKIIRSPIDDLVSYHLDAAAA